MGWELYLIIFMGSIVVGTIVNWPCKNEIPKRYVSFTKVLAVCHSYRSRVRASIAPTRS